jgi:hypothetical protein
MGDDFFVSCACLQGFAHARVFDALPIQKHVVQRAIGVVVADLAGNIGPRFVSHPREDGVAAGAMTWTSGGLFR